MYLDFYRLAKKPFNMTPDPSFLFLTKQHREGLAGLTYAILERKGFLVLTGAAGSGKTTVMSWLLKRLLPDRIATSVILNPTLTGPEFLEMVLLNFGVEEIPASKPLRLQVLQKMLVKGTEENRIHVLVIDEAHKLNTELLEEVRLLGNFENADAKLLQILLIGQDELDETLSQPELFQLKQRIGVHLTLQHLSAGEVEQYIQHRWRIAGGSLPTPFTADAIAAVARISQGVPRLINSLCDNALVLAFADQGREVSGGHIETAATDLRLVQKRPAQAAPVVSPQPVPIPMAPVFRMIGDSGARKAEKPSRISRLAMKLGLA